MHSIAWTDLQHVLAVASAGSLAGAARHLGLNHTTVLRRVLAFERQVGVKLFARLPTGYVLTAAGEEIAAAARAIADTVHDVERRVAGRDLRLTGSVRITSTDTLAVTVLPPILATFQREHAAIQLELTTTTAIANLSKRDADIAVRPTASPPAHLIGRRVGTVGFAVYAAPRYLEQTPARRPLGRHTWVAPDDTLATTTIRTWMDRELTGVHVALRVDTLTAMAHAAIAGIGVAALPCYLGDHLPGLVRVRGVVPDMATTLWVLTHADLRNTARIRAVVEHLAAALSAQCDLLQGT